MNKSTKQKAKKVAQEVGKRAVDAAKRAVRDAVREEVNRLPRELRAPAGKVGNALVKGAAKIFGKGDYTIHSNSLIQGGHVAPVFTNSQHGVRIVDREFVGTVVSGSLSGGSTIFNNTTFRINPANAELFPWLSKIAPLFDQWCPHGLLIEYVSTSSEYNGTSQALGVVMTATDYDVNDPSYGSRVEMENSAYAISAKASSNILHGIECSVAERPTRLLYTQTSPVSDRSTLSDLGNFQLATQGMSSAGVTLGEIYVTYDIEFFKKQMRQTAEDQIFLSSPYASKTALEFQSKGLLQVTATGLFANGAAVDSAGKITFNTNPEYVGRQVRVRVVNYKDNTGSSATISVPTCSISLLVGCSPLGNHANNLSWIYGTSTGDCSLWFDLQLNAPVWSFNLLEQGSTTTTSMEMYIDAL